MNYSFEVNSKTYGTATVIAPERFRAEISAFKWRIFRDRKRPGSKLRVITFGPDKRTLYLHVLVWRLLGRSPVKIIDHIDRDELNNSEENLRDGTVGNWWNASMRSDNTTGFRGVFKKRLRKPTHSERWLARLNMNGKVVYLSEHKTIAEAVAARDAAAKKYHGEFAVLNEQR